MVATHIPAWQRLGLKLKNQSLQPASAGPISPTNTSLPGNAFRKRKVDSDDDTVITSFDSSKRFKHSAGSMSNSPASSRAGSESLSFSESRRKSVTFSADTKAEDGSSSKRLVQAAYAARLAQTEDGIGSSTGKLRNGSAAKTTNKKQPHTSGLARMENGTANATADAQQTSTLGATGDEATNHAETGADSAVPATAEGKQSAQQRSPKKPSNQPSSKAQAAKQKKKQDLAIRYLEEYATARQSWKFNKSRQVAILNMALDIDQLPVTYDKALVSYLEGLQGTASRLRLRGHAKELIAAKGDVEDDSDPNDAQLRRAKLVLEALGSEDQDLSIPSNNSTISTEMDMDIVPTGNASSDARPPTANGIPKNSQPTHDAIADQPADGVDKKRPRRVRYRKRRNASTNSDSSSSSSSDTESDSEGSQD